MKAALSALKQMLITDISYLGEAETYIKQDSWDLMQNNKTPFINILNSKTDIIFVPKMAFEAVERHIIEIQIQYAVSALNLDTLYEGDGTSKGIDDLTTDILTVVKSDTTLTSTVSGLVPGEESISWVADPGLLKTNAGYVAGYTMTVKYFKDYFK
jgi:hypothetical protein